MRRSRKTRGGYGRSARFCCWVRAAAAAPPFPRVRGRLIATRTGSGESGKSTIVKQMKIIHQNGYTVEELSLYRLTIYKNLVDCAKALISAMQQFDVEPADHRVVDSCEYLMDYQVDPDPQKPLDQEVGRAVIALCNDPSFAQTMEHQSEFYLMDSAP